MVRLRPNPLDLSYHKRVFIVLFSAVIHWITPRSGSLAGGTTVNVYGREFATDSYTSHSLILIGQVPCVVIQ